MRIIQLKCESDQSCFDQRVLGKAFKHAQVGERRLAALPIDHSAMAAVSVRAQRQIDGMFIPRWHAVRDGVIDFVNFARIKGDI